MEYPAEAQKILDIMNRTDFKNIKKNEVISLVSKLNDLNPDVAREIIAQFPEVAEMLKVAISEYTENIKNILESNEKSSDKYFEINKKGVDSSEDSKAIFIEMANKVLEDLSKVSDDSSLSFEQRIEIFNREKEVLELVNEKQKETFEEHKYYENKASEKDSENKQFNWKMLGVASIAVASLVGAGVAALSGGEFKLKLPSKD